MSSNGYECAQLPPHWKVVRLGDVYRFTQKPKRVRFSDHEAVPFVPMDFIPIGRLFFDQFVLKAPHELTSGTYFESGDVLISRITPSFENGKQGIIDCLPTPFGIATTEVIPVQEIKGTSDKLYLFYYLLRQGTRSELAGKMEGSTGRQRLSKATLESSEILFPPLPEQRAIARTLRAVQDAIQARRREATLERERKAALMQHLFTHGTRGEARKQTEIGEMPESWRVIRLGELAKIERGKFTHRPRNDPAFYGGNIPFVQTGDVTASEGRIRTFSQTLNEKGLSVSRMFPKGTLVITIAANIGYTGILEFDSAFPDSLIAIIPAQGIDSEFLNYYLVAQQPEIDRKAPQGTQKNINIEFLSPWPVMVPAPDEQRAIATVLNACDAKIAALEREAAALDELFRAMLEELMTGRLSTLPLSSGA
jgi:type I restriction enzyme S subunit